MKISCVSKRKDLNEKEGMGEEYKWKSTDSYLQMAW